MSMQRHILLAALALAIFGAGTAAAQEWTPFVDPFYFDEDSQYFAPAKLEDLARMPEPNTGWFTQLNRMYVYVTRPNYAAESVERANAGDWTWGNRIDVGYMTDANCGWLFSGFHIDGPNQIDLHRIPQINRINEDFNDFLDPDNDDIIINLPIQDRNNIFTNERDWDNITSVNEGELTSLELNKTWRLASRHHGCVIEPFVGARYIKFVDYRTIDSYLRLEADGSPLDIPADPDAIIEVITQDDANWINQMVAGQIGFHIDKAHGRWHLTSDLRAFAAQNWQEFNRTVYRQSTLYDGIGDDSGIITEGQLESFKLLFGGNGSEFVFGCDVRTEAAFYVTRDFALNTGFQWLYFAKGIARGNNLSENNENLGSLAVVFGATINR